MTLFKPNVEKMKAKKNIKGLMKALDYPEGEINIQSAKALGEIGDSSVVESLIQVLQDNNRNPYLRAAAARALGNIKDKRAIDPLIQELKKTSEIYMHNTPLYGGRKNVKTAAAEALGNIKDEKVVEPLIYILKDEWNKDTDVKFEIAKALGKIGESAIEELIKILKDEKINNNIKKSAVWGLENTGWKPKEVNEKIHYYIIKEDYGQLEKIGSLSVEPLIRILNYSEHHDTRIMVAKTLGNIRDKRAVEPLFYFLVDGMPKGAVVWGHTKDESINRRLTAADALRNIGELSIPFLLKTLANEDIEVREQAAYTLYDIGKPGINALLEASKNDKAGLVRKTVTDFLNRIQHKKS